jgi:hypothetical protein
VSLSLRRDHISRSCTNKRRLGRRTTPPSLRFSIGSRRGHYCNHRLNMSPSTRPRHPLPPPHMFLPRCNTYRIPPLLSPHHRNPTRIAKRNLRGNKGCAPRHKTCQSSPIGGKPTLRKFFFQLTQRTIGVPKRSLIGQKKGCPFPGELNAQRPTINFTLQSQDEHQRQRTAGSFRGFTGNGLEITTGPLEHGSPAPTPQLSVLFPGDAIGEPPSHPPGFIPIPYSIIPNESVDDESDRFAR